MCSQHEREAGMMLSTLPAEWLVVGGSARGGFLQELSLVSCVMREEDERHICV